MNNIKKRSQLFLENGYLPSKFKKKKKLLATKGKLIEESIKRYTLKKPIKTIGTI